MKIEKLSLNGIKNVLNRAELKKIMAGGSSGPCSFCGQGGYNCCGCFYGYNTYPSLVGAACGNQNCEAWCAAEGLSYGYTGEQLACYCCTTNCY